MSSSGMGSFAAVTDAERGESQVSVPLYSASKAAVSMLTVQYAKMLPRMRVNAADPVLTATEFTGHDVHTVTEGADAIVELATAGADGPTGGPSSTATVRRDGSSMALQSPMTPSPLPMSHAGRRALDNVVDAEELRRDRLQPSEEPSMSPPGQTEGIRERLDTSLDFYRDHLHNCLDDLDEEEARRSLVPSKTTLLGLVKHVTYVEKFYFQHSITGRPLKDIGVASTPDRSFILTKKDTIKSVRAGHRVTCAESRHFVAGLELGDIVTGRGEQDLMTIYLRTLYDLIHHCGHADILREQILAAR